MTLRLMALRFVLVAVFSALLLACTPAAIDPPSAALTLTAPAEVSAGERLPVTITAPDAADGTPVTLTAIGSYGLYPFRATLVDGRAGLTLPPAVTGASGLMTLVAASGPHRAQIEVTIHPGPATGELPLLVGPRSLAATGRDTSMAVAFPQDRSGNPLADGQPVVVRLQHPARSSDQPGRQETLTTETRGGLAWVELRSGTVAGETTIAAHSGQSHSAGQTLVETAGPPRPFTLTADRNHLSADGRHMVIVHTSPLADIFGNPLPDGLNVTFLATTPTGSHRTIPAMTLKGQAEAQVQAPLQPGPLTVQAELVGVLSQPLTLTFEAGPTVANIPTVVIAFPETVEITAGPMVGPLGQHIPDGTPVQFTVTGPDGRQELTVSATGGLASATLRRAALLTGTYTITVSAGTGQGQNRFEGP